MKAIKARLAALEQRHRGTLADGLGNLSDVALDQEIEAALIRLEQAEPVDELDGHVAEALVQLRRAGVFPLGAFDVPRVERLIGSLQKHGGSK